MIFALTVTLKIKSQILTIYYKIRVKKKTL
jgi:hypothetical protein